MMNGVKYPRIQHFLSLFPAQAGMIRERAHLPQIAVPFPRASGDDPCVLSVFPIKTPFSPRKRG